MSTKLHGQSMISDVPATAGAKSQMRATLSLASLFALRMLGLFMIFPVFAIYAAGLKGATPVWTGLTLGIYGATSCLFQLVFGWASDHFGRKKTIALGLIIFALGSLVAGASTSIYGVFLGRALQGAGAIGAATLALIADLTADEHRTKAMATVGMTIGFSFVIAMALGPLLIGVLDLSGIFYLTAALAVIALLVLYKLVPNPSQQRQHLGQMPRWSEFKHVLANPALLNLDFGIFALHAVLTASFMFIPLYIVQHLAISVHEQWLIYVPALVIATILMVPFVIIAEKKRQMKNVLLIMIALMCLSQASIWYFQSHLAVMVIALTLFFTAFTVLEALLPSWISKVAPLQTKGTAMGVYSSSQYLGAFAGGTIAGLLLAWHDISVLILVLCLTLAVWFVFALLQAKPSHYSSRIIHIGAQTVQQAQALQKTLAAKPGVIEVMIAAEEGTAYLKVDAKRYQD